MKVQPLSQPRAAFLLSPGLPERSKQKRGGTIAELHLLAEISEWQKLGLSTETKFSPWALDPSDQLRTHLEEG